MVQQPPSGPGPPHYRDFNITLKHTTIGRTPLDEGSARRRGLCLTTRNTPNRQASMLMAGIEPAIPGNKQPQPHALDRGPTDRQHCNALQYILSFMYLSINQ